MRTTRLILFRNGLADVIGLDWLRMFSSKELSTLVAGAEHEINVSDLQVCPLTSFILFFFVTGGRKYKEFKRDFFYGPTSYVLSRFTPSMPAATS